MKVIVRVSGGQTNAVPCHAMPCQCLDTQQIQSVYLVADHRHATATSIPKEDSKDWKGFVSGSSGRSQKLSTLDHGVPWRVTHGLMG